MPEKISILKESGESVNSNVVSVFMVPDTQKKYLISTENTVDPHGLTILHVSEIVGDSLQKVASDEEWSSIKTIMRAIISGNVGSYQYLQPIDSAKSADLYSRDISVSTSAAKQMSDNYEARDKANTPTIDAVGVQEEVHAFDDIQEVAPGLGVIEESVPSAEVSSSGAPVNVSGTQPAEDVVAEPEFVSAPVVETAPESVSTPVAEVSMVIPESAPAEDVAQSVQTPPLPPVQEPVPAPVQEVVPVATEEPVSTPVAEVSMVIPEPAPAEEVAQPVQTPALPPVQEPAPAPVQEVVPVATEEPVSTPVVVEAVPVESQPIPLAPVEVVTPDVEPGIQTQLVAEPAPIVVESHLVAPSPVTLPISEPAVQGEPEPVTFVAQSDLAGVQPAMVIPIAQPATSIPAGQIMQEGANVPAMGIKYEVNPSFSPDATLDEVVLASQEMFMEGTRNLIQTIQEKIYRDIYHKEAELKAREEMLNQREKMLNEQMMSMMSNFASMQQAAMASVQKPTKVEVET